MRDVPDLDRARLAERIAEIAGFHDSTFAGWTREVFSDPYRASREWVRRQMADAGLSPFVDAAGNVVGRLPGRRGGGPALVTGSHTDTVRQGGRYDGIVGVLSGIEVAQCLQEKGIQLEHDLVVIDFLGEEANEFGISCMGSRSIAGALEAEHLDREDGMGIRLGDAMERFGLDPNAALRQAWRPKDLFSYVELHVEQGPQLQREGIEIGVVTAIAGIERLLLQFAGQSGHAGTTPMMERHDALVSAANAVLTVERVGCGAPMHGVTTPGRIESSPGSMGVITNRARLWAEIRSIDKDWLHIARRQIVDQVTAEAGARGVEVDVDWLNDQDPVPAASQVQDVIAEAATGLGFSWRAVPSGAGHDAAHLARLGPMGMIFVPSVDGKSHCPDEFTSSEDIERGARVLAATMMALDTRD